MRKFGVTPIYLRVVIASLLAVLFACSESEDVAGTATQTENTVAGLVTHADGSVAMMARVRMAKVLDETDSLRMPEYVETNTDEEGRFSFGSAIADTFQLAVIDEETRELSYLPRVTAESSEYELIQLEPAAVFEGVLYYDKNAELEVAVGSHFKVFVPGTPFFQNVFAGDSFAVLIPSGTWWFTFCPGDPHIVAKLEESGLEKGHIYRSWEMTDPVEKGDTVTAGPFLWSPEKEIDTLMKKIEEISWITGVAMCDSGPCNGAEVMVITDLYGFDFVEGDSTTFTPYTRTDSLGRWWLPAPTNLPNDTFRVEIRMETEGEVTAMGLSKYWEAAALRDRDTLQLDSVVLTAPSGLLSVVSLVVPEENEGSNCMVNSVVIGVKGTAHFVREVTCNPLALQNIPAGGAELVLYTGDSKVVSTLKQQKTPMDWYVTLINVDLPKGGALEYQGITYTPPTLK